MTARLARITPPLSLGTRRSRYVLERNLRVYRHSWVIIFSGFFEPLFYLFSIGVGLGALVGTVEGEAPYAEFVAPALLAASAMNGAVFESTMNIFFKLKFARTYDGMLATPVAPFDIALGEIGWSLIRGGLYAVGFLVVALAMGLMPSMWGLLAVPAALLIGFAFAAVGMATTTYMRSWQDFDMVTLVTLPLFLFSATFYPLDVYPGWLQLVARFSPLYHGVDLVRGLMLGRLDVSLVGHGALLCAIGLVGLAVAGRRIGTLLLQ